MYIHKREESGSSNKEKREKRSERDNTDNMGKENETGKYERKRTKA